MPTRGETGSPLSLPLRFEKILVLMEIYFRLTLKFQNICLYFTWFGLCLCTFVVTATLMFFSI
jgi:hypothetical protein